MNKKVADSSMQREIREIEVADCPICQEQINFDTERKAGYTEDRIAWVFYCRDCDYRLHFGARTGSALLMSVEKAIEKWNLLTSGNEAHLTTHDVWCDTPYERWETREKI